MILYYENFIKIPVAPVDVAKLQRLDALVDKRQLVGGPRTQRRTLASARVARYVDRPRKTRPRRANMPKRKHAIHDDSKEALRPR